MGASVSWLVSGGSVLCHVYGGRPPILSAYDGAGTNVSVSTGGERVTVEHLAFARELADCARRYAEECERWSGVPAGEGAPSAA